MSRDTLSSLFHTSQILNTLGRDTNWNLDVSALMVLVGEREERRYRVMTRSIVECLCPAPVAGLQAYLHDYEWVHNVSEHSYHSPYGGKFAPLSNLLLSHTIHTCELLEDGSIKVYRMPRGAHNTVRLCRILKWTWVGVCWICFAGIHVLLYFGETCTWIGRANCLAFSLWSIAVRLLDEHLVHRTPVPRHVSKPSDLDAVFILGRRNSAFVLEGSRPMSKHGHHKACSMLEVAARRTISQGTLPKLCKVFRASEA
jgi:hypothetical protein